MIYETDIIKALTKRIENFFPAIKVENQDIKNCLKVRPCFFVRSVQTVDAQVSSNYEENSFSFEVIYFATDNNKGYLELLQTKRLLKAILNKPLKIVKTYTDTDSDIITELHYVENDSLTSSINEDDTFSTVFLKQKSNKKSIIRTWVLI